MNFVVVLALVVGVCYGATFNNNAGGARCSYPSWKCDCKLVYDCDGNGEFPADLMADPTVAGVFKDLAPDNYPLRIPGKRWRRNRMSQEDFCKDECNDRMNAFLELDEDAEEGPLTDYSYSAICLELLSTSPGPFMQDGTNEPCCTIYLEYGPEWCMPKWNEAVGTTRCLARAVDASFGTVATGAMIHQVFSVEKACTADGTESFTWCDSAPLCAAPAK